MFRHAHPGDPLKISATDWNGAMDAAAAVRQGLTSRTFATPRDVHSSTIVKIKNSSGADRKQYDLLGLAGPLITPAANPIQFDQEIVFNGFAVNAAYLGQFAVLQEPVKAGQIGRACVAGVTQARLAIANAYDQFSDVTTDPTQLQTAPGGSAQILWNPGATSGSGSGAGSLGYVRLGPPTGFVQGILATTLNAATNGGVTPGTATLNVYATLSGLWQATGQTVMITSHSTQLSAAAGTYVEAQLTNQGEWLPVWVDCTTPGSGSSGSGGGGGGGGSSPCGTTQWTWQAFPGDGGFPSWTAGVSTIGTGATIYGAPQLPAGSGTTLGQIQTTDNGYCYSDASALPIYAGNDSDYGGTPTPWWFTLGPMACEGMTTLKLLWPSSLPYGSTAGCWVYVNNGGAPKAPLLNGAASNGSYFWMSVANSCGYKYSFNAWTWYGGAWTYSGGVHIDYATGLYVADSGLAGGVPAFSGTADGQVAFTPTG